MSASCSSRVRFEVITTAGGVGGRDRPELGDRHREVREHLEQERLELVVGPVELVDQEHRPRPAAQRPQQRPLEQEVGAVQLADPVARVELAGLERPRVQQLPRVVPLVERLAASIPS